MTQDSDMQRYVARSPSRYSLALLCKTLKDSVSVQRHVLLVAIMVPIWFLYTLQLDFRPSIGFSPSLSWSNPQVKARGGVYPAEYIHDIASGQLWNMEDRKPNRTALCFGKEDTGSKCFPSFSIVGMPKSGTSALYFYLKHHPQLVFNEKESCALEPLSGSPPRTNSAYFERLPSIDVVCPTCLVGEACILMGLMADPESYRFLLPSIDTAFLLLRNPLDRLYAAYWFWCTDEEAKMEIPGCVLGGWNPRKNITWVKNGTEYWYNFPRSPLDFHHMLQKQLIEGGNVINGSGFLFSVHVSYVRNLHIAFGDSLHIIPSELLYSQTEMVLTETTKALRLMDYNFTGVASLAVNVNGHPGMSATMSKGEEGEKYPPLLQETIELAKESVIAVATFVETTTGTNVRPYWGLP